VSIKEDYWIVANQANYGLWSMVYRPSYSFLP
jgi:hypothetical protein